MKYGVRLDLREVKKYANDVQKKYVPAAAGIALKRVGTTTRNAAATKIRERLAIRSTIAKQALKVKRIGNGMTISILATGKPIPLRDYGASMTKQGVKYRVARGGKRKLYERQGRRGFIVQSRGGHVFVRIEDNPPGPLEARIQKVFGPSVPQYFVTSIVTEVMEQTARDRWPKEFAAAFRGVLIRRTGVDIGSSLGGLGT